MSKIFVLIVVIIIIAGGIYWWQKDNIEKIIFGQPEVTKPSFCVESCGDGVCQEIVCLAVGCACAETKESCPQDCVKIDEQIDLSICNTDTDCACGVKIGTRECFFGNKKYVNTLVQCPDFCSGIDGKIRIKCVNNSCVQTRE